MCGGITVMDFPKEPLLAPADSAELVKKELVRLRMSQAGVARELQIDYYACCNWLGGRGTRTPAVVAARTALVQWLSVAKKRPTPLSTSCRGPSKRKAPQATRTQPHKQRRRKASAAPAAAAARVDCMVVLASAAEEEEYDEKNLELVYI